MKERRITLLVLYLAIVLLLGWGLYQYFEDDPGRVDPDQPSYYGGPST